MNILHDQNVLTAEHISKSFGSTVIIEDVNICLKQGELICLLGQSGTGKTTLFHVLSGLYTPDKGSVYMNGEDITGKPGRISYMLQKDLLLPYLSVADNAALPLVINGEKKKAAREKASALFATFGLDGYQNSYPSQLSGGMRQRAALLRTYLSSGGAALLDEPFSALDTLTKSAMHKWYLGVMQEICMPTIFITHDIDEAILLSDRIYIMGGKPGRITGEIVINEPKPRSDDFNLCPEFLAYKRRVVAMLRTGDRPDREP